MDELYVEDFASPLTKDRDDDALPASLQKDVVEEEAPPTPYGHFLELEKAIHSECRRPQMVLPYLEEIHEELEKGNGEKVLKLTDELEELLDLDLS